MHLLKNFAPQTRLFKDANLAAEVVAIIPPNTNLTAHETVDEFRRVSFTDSEGRQLEGYVVSNFLQQISPSDGEQLVGSPDAADSELHTARTGWWESYGPKFDRTSAWLAGGLLVVLLSNALASVILWSKIKDRTPPTVHTSCSGSSIPTYMLSWIPGVEDKLLRLGEQAGEVTVTLDFSLKEKSPGSQIYVSYRPLDSNEAWQQVEGTPYLGLNYQIMLDLAYDKNWDYFIEEKIKGETIRADSIRQILLARQASAKFIYIEKLPTEAESPPELKLRFWQLSTDPEPLIEPFIINFFNKYGHQEHTAPAASRHVSELVDLGAGRGVAYEFSIDLDDKWEDVQFVLTFADGTERVFTHQMRELDLGYINLPTDWK